MTRNHLPVIVLVFDISTGEQIRRFAMNMLTETSKRRLARTIVWAVNNNKSIKIFHKRDDNVDE